MREFWRKFGILVTGHDSRQAHRELEAVQAALAALPKPKNEIPQKLRRTWY